LSVVRVPAILRILLQPAVAYVPPTTARVPATWWLLHRPAGGAPPPMGLRANLYRGDDAGGPVDWTDLVAQVDGTTYAVGDLLAGQSRRYGLRVVDLATGLEESGTAAQVTLTRLPSGDDATGPPGGPTSIAFAMKPAGVGLLSWTYLPHPGRDDPATWDVHANTGDTVDWSLDPIKSVAVAPVVLTYSTTITGFVDGDTYSVGVRGASASGVTDGNTLQKTFVAATAPPLSVGRVSGSAVFLDP
jgi:hypothetical protein